MLETMLSAVYLFRDVGEIHHLRAYFLRHPKNDAKFDYV